MSLWTQNSNSMCRLIIHNLCTKQKKWKSVLFFFFLLFSHKWYILTWTGMFLSIKTVIDIPAVFICTCRLNAHMHKVKQLNTFFSFVKGNNIDNNFIKYKGYCSWIFLSIYLIILVLVLICHFFHRFGWIMSIFWSQGRYIIDRQVTRHMASFSLCLILAYIKHLKFVNAFFQLF